MMAKYTEKDIELLLLGIEAQNAKLARYEEALRFYAEKKNYRKVHLNGSHVGADNGETARKALGVEG